MDGKTSKIRRCLETAKSLKAMKTREKGFPFTCKWTTLLNWMRSKILSHDLLLLLSYNSNCQMKPNRDETMAEHLFGFLYSLCFVRSPVIKSLEYTHIFLFSFLLLAGLVDYKLQVYSIHDAATIWFNYFIIHHCLFSHA